MNAVNPTLGLRLRIVLAKNIAIGPGKADLLEGVKETGSIAAAGRRMGMSYKRAWNLTASLNRSFQTPLVDAEKGGREGGGARLTPLGEEVLRRYRRMEALSRRAVAEDLHALHQVVVAGSS